MVTSLIPTVWHNLTTRADTRENLYKPPSSILDSTIPSLYSILATYSPFPSQSVVIGICSDGFPFVLDIGNPRAGSILLVGNNTFERSQILRAICLSASIINRPDQVSLFILTNKPNTYTELTKYPNCQAIVSPYERSAGELVIELAAIVEQRRTGRELGGSILLVVDDFDSINSILNDFSVYLNLKSIVKSGPQNGIWPIITIRPDDIQSSRGQLLRSFGTYIFEKNENNRAALMDDSSINQSELVYESNFNVIVGGRLFPISNLIV